MHTSEQLDFIWGCYTKMSEDFRKEVDFVDYAIGNYDVTKWFPEEGGENE